MPVFFNIKADIPLKMKAKGEHIKRLEAEKNYQLGDVDREGSNRTLVQQGTLRWNREFFLVIIIGNRFAIKLVLLNRARYYSIRRKLTETGFCLLP